MTSLTLPDVNVWLALAMEDHAHHRLAVRWWNDTESESIAFCRFTQIGMMRVLTTSSAMNGKPLTMDRAWGVYDAFYKDPRVIFAGEPASVDEVFRESAAGNIASPKLWADAWLAALAIRSAATLVTFDKALALRSSGECLLD